MGSFLVGLVGLKEEDSKIWPEIEVNGTTPLAFGRRGNKLAFCTKGVHNIKFFLPFTITKDKEVAKKILEAVVEAYKKWVPGEIISCVSVEINQKRWELNLDYVFHHVLINRA